MQELIKAIDSERERVISGTSNELHEAGKRWALFALDTYTEGFLTKALAISKAIAEFTSALNNDAPQE